jgi:hypothetical protein
MGYLVALLYFLINCLLNVNTLSWNFYNSKLNIEDKIKITVDAKELENLFNQKSEIDVNINKLNKIPEYYPFTIEQSLYLVDFFEEFQKGLKECIIKP